MVVFKDGVYQFGGSPVGVNIWMDLFAGPKKKIYFVDGSNGADGNPGTRPDRAFKTIQKAVDVASAGSVIYVLPKTMTSSSTAPSEYAETVSIPKTKPQLSIIGVGNGKTYGGLPLLKIGSGSTPMIEVKAPSVTIANLAFNGTGSTGGGIKLTDDGGTNASSWGAIIRNCYFTNCKCHATNGTQGGAIYSSGAAWRVLIENCYFFNNLASIVIVDTTYSTPQEWVIQNNVFASSANTNVDVDIYVGGSGCQGLAIRNNSFATVDVPAATGGSVGKYISLATGTAGTIDGNSFCCVVGESETNKKTFGASGTAAVVPTTVRMGKNFGETSTTGAPNDYGLVYRT